MLSEADLHKLWQLAKRFKIILKRGNITLKLWICYDPEYPSEYYICKEIWQDREIKSVAHFAYFDDEEDFIQFLRAAIKDGFRYIGTEMHKKFCDWLV